MGFEQAVLLGDGGMSRKSTENASVGNRLFRFSFGKASENYQLPARSTS